jgi:hypothetical protein
MLMGKSVKFSTMLISIFFIFNVIANESPKYIRGDCITPTVQKYSWFGYVAKIEAISKIDGLSSNKNYILWFPKFRSNSVIFSRDIEFKTKKVDSRLCENTHNKTNLG